MLPVIWRPKALRQLENIGIYIAKDNPAAADRVQALIERIAAALLLRPYSHRAGRSPGTWEAVGHPSYIMVYRVGDHAIEVLAVLHARQQYP